MTWSASGFTFALAVMLGPTVIVTPRDVNVTVMGTSTAASSGCFWEKAERPPQVALSPEDPSLVKVWEAAAVATAPRGW